MKIIIFGATGGLGQWTWKTALKAGHEVVAFVRSPDKLDKTDPLFEKLQIVSGDVMNATGVRDACKGCQVAINCTSPAGGNSTIEMAQSIVNNAAASGVEKFYMVGGLGALWVPGSNKTVLLQDWEDTDAMAEFGIPSMPKEKIQKMTKGHLEAMAFMESTGLPYTFVCPGMMVDGPSTSSRVVTLDELGGKNAIKVNFGDIAQVIVDDLEKGELIGHRVCVATS